MIKVKVNGLKTKTIWDLENFQGNLKKLDKDAKDKLKANILKNGFISPVFVWKGKDYVLDGHQRILVVKELIKEGHELETKDQIPIVEIEAETKKQAGEYVLSYNAQYGKITDEGLLEFGKEFELDFNELTETINLEFPQDLFNEENELNDVEPDDPRMIETEIKLGEVYKLGEHKLMCGDATSEEDIKKLMGEEKADMVFTDPPYNLSFCGTVGKFNVFANDTMKQEDFKDFIDKSIKIIINNSKNNASYYVCIDYRQYPTIYTKLEENKLEIMNCIVWDKVFAGMGFKYRFRHEFIIFAGDRDKINWYGNSIQEDVIKLSKIRGKKNHLNLDMKGYQIPITEGFLRIKKERDRTPRVPLLEQEETYFYLNHEKNTDIWEGYSINNFAQRQLEESEGQEHLTMKPIRMIADFIINSSKEKQLVLDVFGGSGSTLIACENTNRKCRMMEIDPVYCQVIINRWERLTGNKAEKVN